MSKEAEDQNQEVETEEQVENIDPERELALKKGWKPEEEYEGDPKDFKTYREFLRNEKLYGTINNLTHKLRSMEKRYNNLKDGVKRITEMKIKDMQSSSEAQIEQLKQRKYEAAQEGDTLTVEKINDAIREVEKEMAKKPDLPDLDDEPADEGYTEQDFKDYYNNNWIKNNSWYETDQDLAEVANSHIIAYTRKNGDASPEEVFEHVDKKMKRFISSDSGPSSRSRKPGSVAPRSPKGKKGGTRVTDVVPEELRRVAYDAIEMMEKAGNKNAEADWVKQYLANKGN